MFLKKYKLYPVILFSLFSFPQLMHAQTDSLFLTVDQLFERGVQYSLQLQADLWRRNGHGLQELRDYRNYRLD